mmetsp:Transcript_13579/g.20531  ORF Transcript_13579/g.20531 Transcript_13579/m.20531 type:complete len:335 (+) Transcript_13579:470-1474(+)
MPVKLFLLIVMILNLDKKTVNCIGSRTRKKSGFPHLLIFPEGTTTNGEALITFKGGAFYPGYPIQPVTVSYPPFLDSWRIHWVPGLSMLYLLWRTLIRPHNRMVVTFLPVYKPSKDEVNQPLTFAKNVRAVMAKSLGVPTSNHALMDVRLLEKGRAHNKFFSTSSVADLTSLLDVSLTREKNDLFLLLNAFRKVDQNRDGKIDFIEFARAVNHRFSQMTTPRHLSDDSLKKIFDSMDSDGDGKLDFREFLLSILHRHHDAKDDRYFTVAFAIYDSNDDGFITRDEWIDIMGDDALFLCSSDKMSFDTFQHLCERHPTILKSAHSVLFDFANTIS